MHPVVDAPRCCPEICPGRSRCPADQRFQFLPSRSAADGIQTVIRQSTDPACEPPVRTVQASALPASAGWGTDFIRRSPAEPIRVGWVAALTALRRATSAAVGFQPN